MECLKCEDDVSELVNWDTLTQEFIECPNCSNKMTVEYDESWNGEEEECYWWLENFIEK